MNNNILIAIGAAVVAIAIGGIFVLVNAYGASQIEVGQLRERANNARAIVTAQDSARLEVVEERNKYDEIIKDVRASKAVCVGPTIQRNINRLPDPRGGK